MLFIHRSDEGGRFRRSSMGTTVVFNYKISFNFLSLKSTLVKVTSTPALCIFTTLVSLVSNSTIAKYNIKEKLLLFCFMWYMCKVPGLLHCCLLVLLVGGCVVWLGCDAVWCWVPGGSVLVWFSGVCVSVVLSAGHMSPSIIVVYSMLY